MAKLSRQIGTTSCVVEVFVQDSSVSTGAGLTGLAYNTSSLTAYYKRNLASSSTAITLATATLGTFASGGFKEVDATNMPGVYEFGIPNAALVTGADSVVVLLKGATNMAPCALEIELTATNNQDGTRGGMTALPNGTMAVKKNTAISAFPFPMFDSTGAPRTGLTVTAQRSLDGAAFASCTNAPTEIANGWYTISLAAGDVNGTCIAYRFSALGVQDTDFTIVTQP
jgi:hypothetical protein